MKTFFIVLLTICVLIAGAVVFAVSGTYNISARVPHLSLTFQLMELVRDRSVAHHSHEVKLPSFDDPSLALKGVIHFDETCRKCHGAPGISQEEFAEGLYPAPPSLQLSTTDMNRQEIYWIIDNGIKMTGMPAFGINHNSEELAAMTAFIKKLPELDAQHYAQFVQQAGSADLGENHHHHEESAGEAAEPDTHEQTVEGNEQSN